MTRSIEQGFGPRLRNAQQISSLIAGFTAYSPPRLQETVPVFTSLLSDIEAANDSESTAKTVYSLAVAQRVSAFRGESGSVEKLLPLISAAVEAQYGNHSPEHKSVRSIIRRMRKSKVIRPPVDPDHPETAVGISSSQQSYGSITFMFRSLKTILAEFTGYNPSNTAIQLPALDTVCTNLDTLNTNADTSLNNLQNARSTRLNLYKELSGRIKRIKAYVKAQYGILSGEYRSIMSVKT